jgi:hypothetical protein
MRVGGKPRDSEIRGPRNTPHQFDWDAGAELVQALSGPLSFFKDSGSLSVGKANIRTDIGYADA